jgi:hypothetical protein
MVKPLSAHQARTDRHAFLKSGANVHFFTKKNKVMMENDSFFIFFYGK